MSVVKLFSWMDMCFDGIRPVGSMLSILLVFDYGCPPNDVSTSVALRWTSRDEKYTVGEYIAGEPKLCLVVYPI